MVSERVQRQINELLDEAEAAIKRSDWALVRDRTQAVLLLDEKNPDAIAYLSAAEKALATTTEASRPTPPAQLPPTPTLPTSFASGRYSVKTFLGEGGKKKVYLAHDTLLDRDVAFALIKTDGLDDTGRERVTREAQAMGRLGAHPHIVSVFDLGEETFPEALEGNVLSTGSRNVPYMVTELMGGGDVEGAIEKAPEHKLPIERGIEIALQVCQGLEFAHSKGVVHRDLKPGNVWLTSDGIAKIGDFGLAVAVDRSRLTREGMMVGTVAYMPPEQAMGGEVTARSDLYALGAMLYELVTGRPPFVGDDSVAIIGQHLNTPPVAPTWHRSDCPPGLEALILRLLEKDATKRPASATEVQVALQSVAQGAAHPDPSTGSPRADAAATDNPLYRRTFVGREQELKQLQSTFDAAVSGQGGLVMVVGEPGIGKTAVCEQLATYVTLRGGKTLVGHCYEEGSLSLPYLAFVEAMRSYVLAREPEALKQELGTGAADVARIVSEVRDKVAVELRPPGDPEDDRWRLYQGVTGFLRNAANIQPLVIILEDLHWADRGTLDYLVHLSRNLQVADSTGRGARLLIIGTYRDVEVDRSHPLSGILAELRRGGSFGRVVLRGLTPDEVQRMITGLTGQDVRWGLADQVHRQTEGNPLFVQEILRYLLEEGLLGQGTSGGAVEMSIPEGLRDVIGKRLSRLSPECNQALTMAAVIGRDFTLQVVRRVAGNMDEDTLLGLLDEAVRVGILDEKAQVGGVQYQFSHALFRQTLYEEIGAARRIRFHQQVARALEEVYQQRVSEHAAELAEHFSHSSDREDLAKAVQYGELAAQRAMSVYDYGETIRLLEQALDVQGVLDPDDKEKRCNLLLALVAAQRAAGEFERVVSDSAPQAFSLAEALGDRHRAFDASNKALISLIDLRGGAAYGTSQYREWMERADLYAAAGTVERAYADFRLAATQWAQGQYDTAWASAWSAWAAIKTIGGFTAFPEGASGFGVTGWVSLPRFERDRLRFAEEIFPYLTQSQDGELLWALANVASGTGSIFLAWGRREQAEELWAITQAIASRASLPRNVEFALAQDVVLAGVDGRLDEALATAERLVDKSAEAGNPQVGLRYAARSVINAKIYLGHAAEVLAYTPELPARARLADFGRVAGPQAMALAHLGRLNEAREVLDRTVARLTLEEPPDVCPTANLLELLEAASLTEHRGAATALRVALDGLEELCAFSVAASGMCVARHLGAAAALLGEPEQARSYYHKAIEVCERIRFRPELALTHLQLAELLLAEAANPQPFGQPSPPTPFPQGEERSPRPLGEGQGEGSADALRKEANEHLDFAIGEFQEMKMQPSLERALRHKGLLGA